MSIPSESVFDRLDRWAADTPLDVPLYIYPHEILQVAEDSTVGIEKATDALKKGKLLYEGHVLKVRDV